VVEVIRKAVKTNDILRAIFILINFFPMIAPLFFFRTDTGLL
jgi:hypothetical protein